MPQPDNVDSTLEQPLPDATRSAALRDCIQTPGAPALQRATRPPGASKVKSRDDYGRSEACPSPGPQRRDQRHGFTAPPMPVSLEPEQPSNTRGYRQSPSTRHLVQVDQPPSPQIEVDHDLRLAANVGGFSVGRNVTATRAGRSKHHVR